MNKMAINQRLDAYLTSEDIKNEAFRKSIALSSPQQVSNWRTLKEPIPVGQYVNIITALKNLNARWFLTGEGSMICSKEYENTVSAEKQISESVVTLFGCKDCIDKEKTISDKIEIIHLQRDKISMLEAENAELKFLLEKRKKSSA